MHNLTRPLLLLALLVGLSASMRAQYTSPFVNLSYFVDTEIEVGEMPTAHLVKIWPTHCTLRGSALNTTVRPGLITNEVHFQCEGSSATGLGVAFNAVVDVELTPGRYKLRSITYVNGKVRNVMTGTNQLVVVPPSL